MSPEFASHLPEFTNPLTLIPIWVWIVGGITFYLIMMCVTWGALAYHLYGKIEDKLSEKDKEGICVAIFFGGVFWPMAFVLMIGTKIHDVTYAFCKKQHERTQEHLRQKALCPKCKRSKAEW